MTITLIINQEHVRLDNSLLRTSKAVTDALADLHQNDIDIEIPFDYWSTIDIYLEFVNKIYFDDSGQVIYPDNLPTIDEPETLTLCFYMESFFEDHTFFIYLMKQAYAIWSAFLPYIHTLPDERLVYLYTPYEFVPDKYRDKLSFFKEWLDINANKQVVLCWQGNEVHSTYVTYYDNGQLERFSAQHFSSGSRVNPYGVRFGVGYGISMAWYENGQLWSRAIYKDGKQNGLTEAWYDNGQPKEREIFKDDSRNGLKETWYEDGRPNYIADYAMGQLISVDRF